MQEVRESLAVVKYEDFIKLRKRVEDLERRIKRWYIKDVDVIEDDDEN